MKHTISCAALSGRASRLLPCAGMLAICMLLVLLTNAVPAPAQMAGKGAISGTVTDKTGAVLPKATLTATNSATGVSTSTTTTGAGFYTFSNLDPGIYKVTVKANGFDTLTQENIHVNGTETQSFNPSLTVGSVSTQVTVTTTPPLLQTSNATLGGLMENEMYSALPLEMGGYGQNGARRASDFALLMPGFQANTTHNNVTDNTSVVNGSGSQGAVTAVYVDGVPFTNASGEGDPRFVDSNINVEAVNQFQVQTSGYSALYEGMGVESYTIKQGGDQFHGTLYEYLRNTAFDTWGFFGPEIRSPYTGQPEKPVEHQNEFGIFVSGPVIRHKLFVFGQYGQYRYSATRPMFTTFPTLAEQHGDFSGTGVKVYDPNSQAACTANSTTGTCRYEFGYGYGGTPGPNGNPVLTGTPDAIPAGEISPVAAKMQSYIPALTNQNLANNYISPNPSGVSQWNSTGRIDYDISANDTLSVITALSRTASNSPVGQTNTSRNVGPVPYNFGQAYVPKSLVSIVEENHVFTPHVLNQFKAGFSRYYDPSINVDSLSPTYAATAFGITGLPAGQTQQSFPFEKWSGPDTPTDWAGEAGSLTVANSYYLIDNVQWVFGRHSLTIGGQIAELEYNDTPDITGASPITLQYAPTETAGFENATTLQSGTGLAYASFLAGQPDKPSLTVNSRADIGARFMPFSPYVEDDWKVSSKLTLNLGLRWDYFPTYTEVHNTYTYFNPTLTNPVTGSPGAIEFAGSLPASVSGVTTCNCTTPVNNYYRNFGPRLGFAYAVTPKTVIRGGWGVMYTHGNAVGGAAVSRTGTGTLGFSAAPSFAANSSTYLSSAPMGTAATWAFPAYAGAAGVASGNAYGTGYTNVKGYTSSPSGIGYADPYLGGRAPEYINWNFGIQRQLTNTIVATVSYVGSEGHFEPSDGSNIRGYWSNSLDPKYLALGSNLNSAVSKLPGGYAAFAQAHNLPYYSWFASNQSLSTALKPFPQYGVGDSYGKVANSNYHSLQVQVTKQMTRGVTFMGNYTWSKAMDDGGTFRTGYPIPVGTLANHPQQSYAADRIEYGLSTTDMPQRLVLTGVWQLPFGTGSLGGGSAWSRALLGGYRLSGIAQFNSGSPLVITAASCPPNPAQSTCEPILNPSWNSHVRVNGSWGNHITAANTTAISYIAPTSGTSVTNNTGPFENPVNGVLSSYAYQFSDAPRTAAYGLFGPGNYDLDLSLRREFALHTENAHLSLQIDAYNLTNHVAFGGIGTKLGSAGFGSVTTQVNNPRQLQMSGRLSF